MQSTIGCSSWHEEDDPETIELFVGIEGVGVASHEVPVGFLDEQFRDAESKREFIQDNLETLALDVSIEWREQQ